MARFAFVLKQFRLEDEGLKPRRGQSTAGRGHLPAFGAQAHRARFANDICQVLSILGELAIDIGWRKDNRHRPANLGRARENHPNSNVSGGR